MTEERPMHMQPIVYDIPAEAVEVEREVECGEMTLDFYRASGDRARGAVILVSGYRDSGFAKLVGCRFKEMRSVVNWAQLFAAAGTTAITYSSDNPAAALPQLFDAIREDRGRWNIDAEHVALYASSGNVPTALAALLRDSPATPRRAALAYGYMLDIDGAVSEAATQFRFNNQLGGKTIDDIRPDVPIFIARAGRDQFPRVNETIDAFATGALARNLPITLANHPQGPHAFDLFDDSAATRAIIRNIVEFVVSDR